MSVFFYLEYIWPTYQKLKLQRQHDNNAILLLICFIGKYIRFLKQIKVLLYFSKYKILGVRKRNGFLKTFGVVFMTRRLITVVRNLWNCIIYISKDRLKLFSVDKVTPWWFITGKSLGHLCGRTNLHLL